MEETNPPNKGDLSGISISLIQAQSPPKEQHALPTDVSPIPVVS